MKGSSGRQWESEHTHARTHVLTHMLAERDTERWERERERERERKASLHFHVLIIIVERRATQSWRIITDTIQDSSIPWMWKRYSTVPISNQSQFALNKNFQVLLGQILRGIYELVNNFTTATIWVCDFKKLASLCKIYWRKHVFKVDKREIFIRIHYIKL